MRRLAPWLVVAALAVSVPVAAAADEPNPAAEASTGIASGTITLCPGFPVPTSVKVTREGVTLARSEICHVYTGTISGVVRGIQDTTLLADTSRMAIGDERLDGTVAGRHGTVAFLFTAERACFPGCPSTVTLSAAGGTGGLRGLELHFVAIGTSVLAYQGTYTLGPASESSKGGNQ